MLDSIWASWAAFHFLRPWWLLFIPYVLWLHVRLRRAHSASLQWQGAIEPALLAHLTVSRRGAIRVRPYQLMTVMLTLASLAVAGPAWEREITPFTEDRAPLVAALQLTPSMLGEDVQPSRLARARHKLRDLLERRRGARTALVAYAGSAHVALPLTDDAELLESYLDALDPALMPRPGNDPGRALALAETLLAPEPVAGSVLFLTDGIDRAEAEAFRAFAARTGAQPLLLGFGRDLDRAGLEAVADAAGGRARVAALDDGDVDALERGIRTHLVDALGADDALDWRDRGHALVWGVAFCMAFWFRRGWTVQWRV